MLEVLLYLLFGGIIGWVASIVVGDSGRLGIIGNVIVGIVGMFIGNLILPNDTDTFDLGTFIAGVIGAIILLLVVNLLAGRNKKL
jgi:uncharacterized membrane protein YeaQ/YmgE (transglycosylase-associated protein family)